ncbi:hypothetical protein GS928_25030 [Rhodococcus hoagii]|nr:hypothetical protein [Prescottella equi]
MPAGLDGGAAELGALASLGGLRLGLPAALVGVPAVPDGPGVAQARHGAVVPPDASGTSWVAARCPRAHQREIPSQSY